MRFASTLATEHQAGGFVVLLKEIAQIPLEWLASS